MISPIDITDCVLKFEKKSRFFIVVKSARKNTCIFWPIWCLKWSLPVMMVCVVGSLSLIIDKIQPAFCFSMQGSSAVFREHLVITILIQADISWYIHQGLIVLTSMELIANHLISFIGGSDPTPTTQTLNEFTIVVGRFYPIHLFLFIYRIHPPKSFSSSPFLFEFPTIYSILW